MRYIVHPRTQCTDKCSHEDVLTKPGAPYPANPSPAVLAGPGAFYPAEATVPPVWRGGAGGPALNFARGTVAEQVPLFPIFEVSSRDGVWPEDMPVPRAVTVLEGAARAAGWRVRLQYSRGHGMHATTARPLSLCHWAGVRMLCGSACGCVAYAVYRWPVTGAGAKGWTSMRHPGGAFATLADLRVWLDGHGDR